MNNIENTPTHSIRDSVGEQMVLLGLTNEKVVVVNADLMGTCRTSEFAKKYPNRSFNVGIAEQNMVSFAAGLAHEGFLPYAFSMAPFLSMRACEQCRTDVAYGNLNVRLIATYAGCSGGISGATHWGIEDCAILGGIPQMTILEPSDAVQAKKMLEATLTHDGPVYIRSSVQAVSDLYDETVPYEIGKATIVRQGNDGTFLCSGAIVQYAVEASKQIERETAKKIRVVDMHTIKPIDKNAVLAAAETKRIVVAQDHNVVGGLGYFVSAVLAENGVGTKFKIAGISDNFSVMAHTPYLYHRFGLDAEGLTAAMLAL